MATSAIVALVACVYIAIGLLVVRVSLRFDERRRKVFSEAMETMPLVYVFALLFGAFIWPWVIFDMLRRFRARRACESHDDADLPAFVLPPEVECPNCKIRVPPVSLEACPACGHQFEIATGEVHPEDLPSLAEGALVAEIPCPSCRRTAKLYSPDSRTRGWYRVVCDQGHWGDLGPDSTLLPEELRRPPPLGMN